MRLIRSELMKIRTTNTWWIFSIGIFAFTSLMLAVWTLGVGNDEIHRATMSPDEMFGPGAPPDMTPEQIAQAKAEFLASRPEIGKVLINVASQVYTSGQFFTLLFIMLLGAILITNEFFHQTATATFLTTPQRTKVILAKFGAIGFFSVLFWLAATAVSVGVGMLYFSSKGYGNQLDHWEVQRPILMNLVAFVLWGILGVGLGVLLRSQIGAVVTGAVAYIIGTTGVQIVAQIVYHTWIEEKWVLWAQVLWPSVASQVMISPEAVIGDGIIESPKWWVGLIVLVGYGILFGFIGTLITRKRDIT